jgi:hypothetical protein
MTSGGNADDPAGKYGSGTAGRVSRMFVAFHIHRNEIIVIITAFFPEMQDVV